MILLQFVIADDILLEMIMFKIREITIKFSGTLKRKECQVEKILIKDIEKLESNENACDIPTIETKKEPGIDGFPAEFFNIFWGSLRVFVVRAINYCYQQGTLSLSMRQSVITCIPEEENPQEYLKNWHPISLLTVPYKIISLAIAERVKKVD